ncbi:MAG: hypothetical protein LBG71_03595 [Clostridiales Family XIII bacterium]|jgi:shikimate dehydrogenase|nr:hypothetical protein [Clostridiales Family XIII bacterium]
MRNIVLTGLPGSGKTTLGLAAAELAGLDFRDMDAEIERAAGMSVSEIFAAWGEARFREMETEEARRAAEATGAVISTGGGVVLREDNMRLLAKNGFIIFIDRDPTAIAGDVECAGRPLLAEGAARLFGISKERRPLYLKSAHAALANDGGFQEALGKLMLLVNGEHPGKGFGVIGDPIGHTRSPEIHKAVFAAHGLGLAEGSGDAAAWDYKAMHVKRGGLGAFVRAARESGLRGFNVTIPHKQDIMDFLDDIDEEARLCGAVNTVVIKEGRLTGHNTDMGGLQEAIRDAGFDYGGSRVTVLGTGGAAAGVAYKAAACGAARVRALGRRKERAEALAANVRRVAPGIAEEAGADMGTGAGKRGGLARRGEVLGLEMSPDALAEAAADTDILVNATPLGMEGAGDFESLGFLEALPRGALVCDLVYGRSKTALLKKAEEIGIKGINGLGMLVYQALLADELYMGRTLDRRRVAATIIGRFSR